MIHLPTRSVRWLIAALIPLFPLAALGQTPPAIIISEIHYNPAGDEAVDATVNTEFIEIKNVGTTAINLSTIGFGIYDDGGSGGLISFVTNPTLNPGQFAVFPRSQSAFQTRYPGVAIAGLITARSFSNTGERIRLRYTGPTGTTTFFSLTYGSRAPWPSLPDGSGFTLVSANPNFNDDPDDPLNWRVSTNLNGSPGADDPAFPLSPIVINELYTRDDATANVDVFEIANFSDSPVDIGNWFLSDDNDLLKRFKIPSPTIVPARGFVTFTQAQLGFGVSGAGGDELKLIAADAAGNFTGYKHGAQPGAGVNQRSFNRVVSADGREFFQPSQSNTLGAANSAPYVGPVIFSKINYNPSVNTIVPAVVRSEYVELVNRSSSSVNLFSSDPNISAAEKSWRVKGVASATNTDFAFPANTTLAAGEIVLLIPARSGLTEAQNISSFRTTNKVPASVTKIFVYYGYDIAGGTAGIIPTDGNILSNGGQILELARPERIASVSNTIPPVTTFSVNYLTEDFAAYQDNDPWPEKTDGDGPTPLGSPTPDYLSRALVRINPDGFGSDPRSWANSVANGGTPGYALFPTAPGVLVNEILAHTDLVSLTPRTDFIELHNPTSAPLDVSGWWLTNSLDKLATAYDRILNGGALATTDPVYVIPVGTIIPAGGYWAVNGDNDDNVNTVPPAGFYGSRFSLNSRGDSCYLVAVNSSNILTGYFQGSSFGAQENPVALVRYRNSEGRFSYLPASSITAAYSTATAFPSGAANSLPKVSPVIISEIMYDAPTGGYEFVEIHNNSDSTQVLYNPTHGNNWKLDGVTFTFPGSLPTIAARETLIVTEAPSEATFRAAYPSTPAGVRIFTWSAGQFSNQGETVALQKPDKPDVVGGNVVVPYMNVDEVHYQVVSPWPDRSLTGGFSLERRNLAYVGDDAGNWKRSATVLGTPGVVPASATNLSLWNQTNYSETELVSGTNLGAFDDFNGDGFPNLLHYLYGLSPKVKPSAGQLPAVGRANVSGQDYLSLTYREQAGTVDFGLTPQQTVDLLTWGTTNIQSVSRVALGGGVDQVTVRFANPLSSTSKAFLRLSAGAK